MHLPSVITWTLMINAYAHHGDHKRAMDCYREMNHAGAKPNNVTLVSILASAPFVEGMLIHASIVEYGFDKDVKIETALINLYSNHGSIEDVDWLFTRMGSRDVVAWNTLIAAYVQQGMFTDSFQLYIQMEQNNVKPNQVTFVTLLGACCHPGKILQGLMTHASIVEGGFVSEFSVHSALITMYSRCKSIQEAQNVFSKVHPRSIMLWNAMLTGCVESGNHDQALSTYEEMRMAHEVPNTITLIAVLSACTALVSILYGMVIHATVITSNLESHKSLGTAILNFYGKCGNVRSSRKVFDNLSSRDLITWNAMLSVYVSNEHQEEAFQLYQQMLTNSMTPDRFTFNTLLSACCSPSFITQGQELHKHIYMFGMEGRAGVSVGVVNMYSKCNNLDAARNIFDQQNKQDVALWNTMFSGYVHSNSAKEALLLFDKMGEEEVKPDGFTFSAVIGACSDLAKLEQGKALHGAVIDAGLDSDGAVENALVHMYCKCGNMKDAWSIFKNHPDQNTISWNGIVSGYAQHGHGYEALHVFERMQGQNVKASKLTFVAVLAACAHVGLVEQSLEYFDSMRDFYGILPDLEHYASIVDLFGRVGRLDEAAEFLHEFPVQPDVVVWKVLLGSCRVHSNIILGRVAAEHSVELDLENSLSYVILSNLYASYDDCGFDLLDEFAVA
ncbi:hypothetical protein KP509_38G035700 [Ceratopteris richardii]|nr:hypothetical protein KP509_38G035700 [Ceratopteris richardii]